MLTLAAQSIDSMSTRRSAGDVNLCGNNPSCVDRIFIKRHFWWPCTWGSLCSLVIGVSLIAPASSSSTSCVTLLGIFRRPGGLRLFVLTQARAHDASLSSREVRSLITFGNHELHCHYYPTNFRSIILQKFIIYEFYEIWKLEIPGYLIFLFVSS